MRTRDSGFPFTAKIPSLCATILMKQRVKWIFGGVLLAVGLLQFTNPARTNPPVVPGHDFLASNAPPAQIVGLLRGACYDCHSFESQWPWYSRVAPISWWVVGHVNDGRKDLNFSAWPYDRPDRERSRYRKIRDTLESGEMPLSVYAWMHPAARLSDSDRKSLAEWADAEAQRLKAADGGGEK